MKHPSPDDIAEMRARGYDVSSIVLAEERCKRWYLAKQVRDLIQEAFADVHLGAGIGLQEAQGLDDYESEETCARYRSGDEKEDWHRITADRLNACSSSLSFFDAEGMRFHLPAYLIADLDGSYRHGMAFHLSCADEYSVLRFALLSAQQHAAVRAFVAYIAEEECYAYERPHLIRALDGYWRDPASSACKDPGG